MQIARSTVESALQVRSEVSAMRLIKLRTQVPVPEVFGFKADDDNPVGAAFILMEYIPGNVATDADGGYPSHHGRIPLTRQEIFFRSVQIASIRFPKIGTITWSRDSGFDIGPFPIIGGPFETATSFFRAWAAHAFFPMPVDEIKKILEKGPVDDVLRSIQSFPERIEAKAHQLSSFDSGPFPVAHPDFFHSNIVINREYEVLSVIDWEGTCTLPWELMEFPPFLETVPVPMDAPWNYDENGEPNDEETKQKWMERRNYLHMVQQFEAAESLDDRLSSMLATERVQNLAYALRVYKHPGKLGFYDKVLEQF
ncbi:hypothetical protein PG988_000325 [Apiospora saccharicola]